MQKATTITSEVYCETLKAIQNKRRGMLTSDVVIFHYNVHLHTNTDAHTRPLPKLFNWTFFDHPPNNADVALSNYHLFTYLMNWWRSQCFNNNEELLEDVKT
jgi:hypothetical protein